ncbi:MAG: cation transporter [Candidatus Hydrogenedentota bacterium]
MKRVEIFYFEGCPNHPPAVRYVERMVAALELDVTIEEVEVHGPEDANALRFLGSPSIRVDGLDIEPEARTRTGFGYSCRTYDGQGLPSSEMLATALTGMAVESATGSISESVDCCLDTEDCCSTNEVVVEANSKVGIVATGGSLVAAILASACCWIPLTFVAVGVSAGGAAAMFETTRPFFLVVAAVMLSVGFYFSYARDAHNVKFKRFNRSLLWVSTVGVAIFAAFPLYVDAFAVEPATPSGEFVAEESVDIYVTGMSCEGCEVTLNNTLAEVIGVTGVEVSYEGGLATVQFVADDRPMEMALLAAVERAGYKGSFDVAQATPQAVAPTTEEESVEETTLKPFEGVDALKAQFNGDKGKRRLLLLFSPT